jgi:DNA-directed RNA polymerase subunit RPC12/RpoP
MPRRKPVFLVLLFVGLLLFLLGFVMTTYLFIGSLLVFISAFRLPKHSSKCPKCKKDNTLEPWVTDYFCNYCSSSLYKEKDGWSRSKDDQKRRSE